MTDNTEAMELWREAVNAFAYYGEQAAAAIIAAKLAELWARITELEADNTAAYERVGFAEEKQRQAEAGYEAVNAHLPKYQAALARIRRLDGVLHDIVNPLGKLAREAEAKGVQLSGMAYSIANDLAFVQSIARQALEADHGA